MLALAVALWAGCGEKEKPVTGPIPALSRPGLQWQVSRGERRVFSMTNEAGRVHWTKGETESNFVSGVVSDAREEARLRQILKQSRHFRDLVHQLERAGYGVAPADAPKSG